ncbi:hypothetical protein A3C87_00765 [Candidatus Kaiserbacteria bacterium RIFCSPHIGHO2_02_FULL_49_34]|uniref:SpoVR family protein n=1 Tax=Candidatus Kaiserbacteria bacterium RIFCSPHIGHO2_02_FULL_49_34 TaxID=1798491 RepID=A0A1F6DKI2_9BACT|nr:MAG: hypothetical protein A3C87_00765 [Candidatus Kaiserbacteria bacterium RIFCSPHIGHO2_02_FULL_49_34]
MSGYKQNALLPYTHEWTFESVERHHAAIDHVARGEFALDIYPIQIEYITSAQMLDRYSSVGLPVDYADHWSRGQQFVHESEQYKRGQQGLAYEIVINTDPCIGYLMEQNSNTMQALVIAHACYGHNSFFKGNYLFQMWTEPSIIVDFLVAARAYIKECETKYTVERVERLLDACHALMMHGVDRVKRPHEKTKREKEEARKEREEYRQSQVNDLWAHTIPGYHSHISVESRNKNIIDEPQENILKFCEEKAPFLEAWEREIIRIVREVAQYFWPQRQTQVMNEGWATFWHYTILQRLYDTGVVGDPFMFEFLKSHAGVVRQLPYNHPYYSGINPYYLGLSMYTDIRRIAEGGVWRGGTFHKDTATQQREDAEWFPKLVGKDWREVLDEAMRNYRDDSFVAQFLSPKVMRDMKLFSTLNKEGVDHTLVQAIHDEDGYHTVRENLSQQYSLSHREAVIVATEVDVTGDRTLRVEYQPHSGRQLEPDEAYSTTYFLAYLWTCPVELVMNHGDGTTSLLARVDRVEFFKR